MQASHHAIAAHRLVVLAEVNTMSQDWGYLLFKLSLAEALEEVATSITEEAWLYNENAINFCFYYIHCFNLCSLKKRISKITMSLTKLYGAYINVPSETSTNCIWILTITRAIINFNRSKPVIGVWDIFSAIRLLLSDV